MGQKEGDGQCEPAKDEHVFLPGRHAIHPEAVVEIFLEATGFGDWADVAEGCHLASTHRAAEADSIQVFKCRAGFDPNLFDPFIRVVDVATTAALKSVGSWIAGRFGRLLQYLWIRLSKWLEFVAQHSAAVPPC